MRLQGEDSATSRPALVERERLDHVLQVGFAGRRASLSAWPQRRRRYPSPSSMNWKIVRELPARRPSWRASRAFRRPAFSAEMAAAGVAERDAGARPRRRRHHEEQHLAPIAAAALVGRDASLKCSRRAHTPHGQQPPSRAVAGGIGSAPRYGQPMRRADRHRAGLHGLIAERNSIAASVGKVLTWMPTPNWKPCARRRLDAGVRAVDRLDAPAQQPQDDRLASISQLH